MIVAKSFSSSILGYGFCAGGRARISEKLTHSAPTSSRNFTAFSRTIFDWKEAPAIAPL